MRASVLNDAGATDPWVQRVLPLLCNDAASYVLSAWRVVSRGQIQEQLVMLFFYNDAASYELSVWRVSSCGHV